MVMHPLLVSSASVVAIPNVPFEKASNSNTPEREMKEKELIRRRKKWKLKKKM